MDIICDCFTLSGCSLVYSVISFFFPSYSVTHNILTRLPVILFLLLYVLKTDYLVAIVMLPHGALLVCINNVSIISQP
jgi:hypothetical protein